MRPDFVQQLTERIIKAESSLERAHSRLDHVVTDVQGDVREIKADVKELAAWMHRSRGWAAASLFGASIIGGLIAAFIPKWFP